MNAITPAQELRQNLEAMKPQFQMALPKHISVEKFTRVVQTAINNTPALLQADRHSLFSACMQSAQDGLMPDGKSSAFVTFKGKDGVQKVQYMPMIAGLLKLVRNSGELLSITSQLVYEADMFKYYVDEEGEHLKHEPNILAGNRGNLIGAYALAKTKDGGVYIEVMSMEQLNQIRNSSRSKDYGPWATFPTEMYRKTVLRRLIKRLPLSTDVDFQDENDYEFVNEEPVIQQTESKKTKPKKLTEIIESQNQNKKLS